MSFISYAQNYEDVMLARALRGVAKGFYIDVGAQDPVHDSVTKAFYEMGWRGINIEPVTHWFNRLVADRPQDINLQLAVSDSPGILHLFEVVDSGLSTTDPNFAARHIQAGHQICESDIECLPLDKICEAHGVGEIQFLKIDCEGGEAAALRGLSLDRIRPWIILLEATEPNSQKPAYMEWESLLTEHGYHFVYEDGLNRFYVSDEQCQLDVAFAYPPNIFDGFVRAPEAMTRRQLESAQGDLLVLRDTQRLLRANVQFLDSENKRREDALIQYRKLSEQLEEREAASLQHAQIERDQWRVDLDYLRSEVGRLHHEVAFRDDEVARLHKAIHKLYASMSWRITSPLRFCARTASATLKKANRIGYHLVRWPAHLLRPSMRFMARSSAFRAMAVRVAGADSQLTIYARLFLFGRLPTPQENEPFGTVQLDKPLTRHAAQIFAEIQQANQKQQSGDSSFRSRGA